MPPVMTPAASVRFLIQNSLCIALLRRRRGPGRRGGIGIARNLRRFAKRQESPLDRLWRGREWRDLPAAKVAAGRRLSPEEFEALDKPWVERFRRKMPTIGFEFQDEADPCFRNEKNVPMYHLLFFARHPAGLTIWRNIKKVEPSGQRTLF